MTFPLEPGRSFSQGRLISVALRRQNMHRSLKQWKRPERLVQFLCDEQGGEVLEYALVTGLIIVAAISAIASVGGKVLARWNSLKSSI
jgi:pilus assembly protein Flp/PilA